MNKIKNSFVLLSAIGLFAWAQSARAELITVNYTFDNTTVVGGICAYAGCNPLNAFADFSTILADGTEPNAGDWRNADSVSVDLAPGTYDIAFIGDNVGTSNPRNPGGFLAEILWGGNSIVTSSDWFVTIDGYNWVAATEWAQNGTGIWGSHLVDEISTGAQWLWTANNFGSNTNSRVGFRTSFTVPEPGTLALFGLALLGVGVARRRQVAA